MTGSSDNPKAKAWDGMGSAYWDCGYDGGPSIVECDMYLRGVEVGDPVLVVGASTVRLIQAAVERRADVTVADFSPVMLDELREVVGDQVSYAHVDVTRPGPVPLGAFSLIVADRLINRFTIPEMRLALTTLTAALRRKGELRLTYRVGLYERDLPVLAEAKRRGELDAVFDPTAFDVDYSGAGPWLADVLPAHGQISVDRLVAFYTQRGREHRVRPGELEELLRDIAANRNWQLAVSSTDLPMRPNDRILTAARVE